MIEERILNVKISVCIDTYFSEGAEGQSVRIGKVVGSHDAVVRSIPTEVALIYTMHEALRGYCP